MVKLNKQLKGATLVESLVAMAIILFCMAIATTVFVNVLKSDDQLNNQKGILLLNEKAIEIIKQKNFIDEELQLERFILSKSTVKYKDSDNLYCLTLILKTKENKVVYTRKQLIVK